MENVTYDSLSEAIKTQALKTEQQFERTDRQLEQTDRQLKILAKKIGEITDTLGRFAEEQVRPKLLKLFKAKGILMDSIVPHLTVQKNGQFLLEIDLLLVSTQFSVVTEVKNTLRQRDVDEHVERLQKLQTNPHILMRGTSMIGAIAGMIVSDEAESYAINKGLFVVRPNGKTVKISNADNFKPTVWELLVN